MTPETARDHRSEYFRSDKGPCTSLGPVDRPNPHDVAGGFSTGGCRGGSSGSQGL